MSAKTDENLSARLTPPADDRLDILTLFLERTFPLHAFMFLPLLLAFTDVEIFEH